MTADIRTAAQREAERRWPDSFVGLIAAQHDFVNGAVWAQARVTPRREQVIDALAQADGQVLSMLPADTKAFMYGAQADAVLALMQGLAEGESD